MPNSPNDGRDDMNLDYRILSLLLACATRADVLDDYLNKDGKMLKDFGFPEDLLAQSKYIFRNQGVTDALRQTQVAMRTLVNINDYCEFECPADDILTQITKYTAQLGNPLQVPGKED